MPDPADSAKRCPKLVLAPLIVAFGVWLPATAQADDRASCLDRVAARDLAGKIAFQNGLFEAIVDGEPDFAALAVLNRDLQLALAGARAAKFGYLLKSDPGRIETGGTLTAFRNFEWTEADEAALRRDSETYRDLARRIEDLRRRSDGHADWPRMRAYFAEGLVASPAYRELTAQLAGNDAEVAEILQGCPRD